MKTGSERQAWLDYVRFFSIFLVVVVHTPPRLELFDDGVYTAIDLDKCVRDRTVLGGPAPREVRFQAKELQKRLAEI